MQAINQSLDNLMRAKDEDARDKLYFFQKASDKISELIELMLSVSSKLADVALYVETLSIYIYFLRNTYY